MRTLSFAVLFSLVVLLVLTSSLAEHIWTDRIEYPACGPTSRCISASAIGKTLRRSVDRYCRRLLGARTTPTKCTYQATVCRHSRAEKSCRNITKKGYRCTCPLPSTMPTSSSSPSSSPSGSPTASSTPSASASPSPFSSPSPTPSSSASPLPSRTSCADFWLSEENITTLEGLQD